MFEEYEKILTAMMYSSDKFLKIAHENLDPYGDVDFEKMEELGIMNEYKEAARATTEDGLRVKIFEEFLKSRGSFEDEKSKDAIGTDLQSQIEEAKKEEKFTLSDNAHPAMQDNNGNFIPSMYVITVGGREYDVTGKSVDEQVAIYRSALEDELQKSVGQNMTDEEKENIIRQTCMEVYNSRNKYVKPLLSEEKTR